MSAVPPASAVTPGWEGPYWITFAASVTAKQLAQACVTLWALPAERILVAGFSERTDRQTGGEQGHRRTIAVVIESGRGPDAPFDAELSGGLALSAWCGRRSELALATELCVHLETRALLAVLGSRDGTVELLVTEDGWHGPVATTNSINGLGIDFAFWPVPAAPHLPVIHPAFAPARLAAGMGPGAPIPQAGWLTPEGTHSPTPTAPSRYRPPPPPPPPPPGVR